MTKNPNHVNAQNEREFSSSVSITDACTTSFDDIRDTLLTILWNKLYQNKKKSNPLQPLQYEIFKVIYIASLYLQKKKPRWNCRNQLQFTILMKIFNVCMRESITELK